MCVASVEADGTKERFIQTNRFDGEGLRYETEENGKIIRFLFDRGELAQEKLEDEEISYVRGYHPISLNRSGKDRNYFVQDEMGSTLFLLDQDHEIRKTYRYDAFGTVMEETEDLQNRLSYTGQMYDGATGQYYLRARFYNPKLGRFMQEDTYRGDGLNLYAYCANNPVMYYDPSGYIGLCPQSKVKQYENDNPLDDPKLKDIYDRWHQNGIDEAEALEYLRRFGNRPDVEYLPYIDRLTKEAYQNVLADEHYLLPETMYELLQEKPYLRDPFIGSAVDWEFKRLVDKSPYIPEGTYSVTPHGAWGADLYFVEVGKNRGELYWIDITTNKQAQRHFSHYVGNGYVTPYR